MQGARCESIPKIRREKRGIGAHPARHRLEACATIIFLSRRGACPLFFTENREQKTENILLDAKQDN